MFPEILKSVAPNEFTTRDAKEVVDNKGANNDGKRARIFQKLTYDKASKKYKESDLDLTNAEKAIIKEMISEYSALLQVTGKEHYADTGEGQRVDFDSFINQANTFIGFNKNLESGVWKNLTSKRALRGKDYEELKDIFGFDYNKKKKRVEFKNDLFEDFQENHRKFEEKGVKAAGGRARKSLGEIKKLVTSYRQASVSESKS